MPRWVFDGELLFEDVVRIVDTFMVEFNLSVVDKVKFIVHLLLKFLLLLIYVIHVTVSLSGYLFFLICFCIEP